jgi:hypothetical protein
MVKMVIALCLFINGEMVEYRIQPDISTCLKMKREATRNMEMNNKRFMCSEAKAELEKNIDGSITIKRIIEH